MTEPSLAVHPVEEKQIARPLRVLVPLIKEDLAAAELARMPHHRAAGEKMLEAKSQIPHGQFGAWVNRHFQITQRAAQYYMSLVKTEKRTGVRFSSMDDFRQRHLGEDRGRRDAEWQRPVSQIMNRVDIDALRQATLKRAEECGLKRKLAMQLIDIGYNALASKLHPDKGGSSEAMTRLNEVRDELKQHAWRS